MADTQIIQVALLYFALVFVLGFLLGAIRAPFIVPNFGVSMAEILEMPLMLVGIILAARFVFGQFVIPNSVFPDLSVGLLAFSLTLIAELLVFVV